MRSLSDSRTSTGRWSEILLAKSSMERSLATMKKSLAPTIVVIKGVSELPDLPSLRRFEGVSVS